MYKNKQRQTSIIINHKLIQKVQKESVYLETLPSPFKKNIKGKIPELTGSMLALYMLVFNLISIYR